MAPRIVVLALVWLWLRPAVAAELDVTVHDTRRNPVAEAVVSLIPHGTGVAAAAPKPRTKTVDQKNLTFAPYIETFRPGDAVVFHNSDRTRHHVYSFSPVKQFEFVLAAGEDSQPLRLDQTGVVAVGCNIHDQMIAFLYVSDAPWIARTQSDGRVHFSGLPAGDYEVRVWQPRLKPETPDLVRKPAVLAGTATTTVSFTLDLLPDLRVEFDREHTRY